MKKITLLLSLFVSFFISSQTLEQSFVIDFGPTRGTNGAITASPDSNGNYWNNATSGNESSTVDIINTTNDATSFKMVVTDDFVVNTSVNYGPLSVNETKLGDLSITTAVQDYFYLDGNASGQVTFENLDINKGYKFYVFASRPTSGSRISDYTFSGSDAFYDVFQTSDGGTGNKENLLETPILRPNSRGKITINVSTNTGGFSYLNALKFEEYRNLPTVNETLEQSFVIDFGPSGGDKGAITESLDANNNYWNNALSADIGSEVNIVNTANVTSNLIMEVTDNFQINSSNNYGPTTTDATELGDLSITTAVQDYFFLHETNSTGQLTFKNLDVNKKYKFYVFASRPSSSTRISNYLFQGIDTFKSIYRTSDGGNGNTDNILETQMMRPSSNGEIILDLSIYTGGFAYINVLKLEEYSGTQIVELVSLDISGNDIVESGANSQMNINFTPNNATYQNVIWSVDNETIAIIDSNGLLKPIANGVVNVTATSKENPSIFDTQEITISNQITALYISGTATENGDNLSTALPMHMVNGLQKNISNVFEIYTSLSETGEFKFYTSNDSGTAVVYGEGAASGELQISNVGIDPAESGPVLITVNLNNNTYRILPINWSVVGSAIPNGWNGDETLVYQGNGIWSNTIDFTTTTNGDDSGRLIFRANQDSDYEMNKIVNTQNVILKSRAEQFGITREDININYGQFKITLNLKDYTYNIECANIDNLKISFMGSSVAHGQGAQDLEGYTYQFDQILKRRTMDEGTAGFYRSDISIGGNNTINLLNRYERDLIGDCSKYVVFGLSLGNEGVHENGQTAFDQFEKNLKLLIQKAKSDGKIPVVVNNYTRADYNSSDYNYIKQMNLLIGEWDVSSVNVLGAIDDGNGKWAEGYKDDALHPNKAGHTEFTYAFVPSLFEALEANKPLPVFTNTTSISFTNSTTGVLNFTPENIVHPFTTSIDFKTNSTGQIITYKTDSSANGSVTLDENGFLKYTSPTGLTIVDDTIANDNLWHNVTLTHFYARGETLLYRDAVLVGSVSEKVELDAVSVHPEGAPVNIDYRNWLFYRSGMNDLEIDKTYNGILFQSSLELYAPLDATAVLSPDPFVNLAQSTNTIDADNVSLGYKEFKFKNIQIYPNPVEEILNIKMLDNDHIKNVTLYNTNGSLLEKIGGSNKSIDFKLFPTGLYFIKVQTSSNLYTLKIVKK